ncbi:cation channel sperm-associated protein 1-like [Rhopilema esculentum]|uniref:cation channel sperm-associated protein 1-like n=1 Tax=Rhopilema esculentum TaxID=499914 RepID=UPI0031D3497E
MANIETGTFRSRKINDASSVLTEQFSDEDNLQRPEEKIFKLPPHLPKNASDFRIFIYEVTESKSFGGAILFVILLNTVILVAQTSESLVMKGGWYFAALDNVFLSIYIVELVMKLYGIGFKFFKTGWNIMDFLIVLCTTVDFLMPLIVQNVGIFDVAAIFRLLRMFRAIRALRALRVLRTIRFLKNLQVVLTTVLKSFKALSTIVMLQTLFLYMFAVVGRGLFHDVAKNRFGTLGRSFFTLFQLITLDDWYEVYSEVLTEKPGHGYIIVYLIMYIVLENFIFMNLFVAVLVDNFQRAFTAVEGGRRRKENDSGQNQRTLFRVELEDSDQSDDEFFSDSDSDDENNSQAKKTAEMPEQYNLKSIDDYYPASKYAKRERELFQDYLTLLGTLEFNIHQAKVQQKLLDDLVDIVVTIPDAPEELV